MPGFVEVFQFIQHRYPVFFLFEVGYVLDCVNGFGSILVDDLADAKHFFDAVPPDLVLNVQFLELAADNAQSFRVDVVDVFDFFVFFWYT